MAWRYLEWRQAILKKKKKLAGAPNTLLDYRPAVQPKFINNFF